ncbi:hypothetical protein B0J13DRAFT_92443 [Dactylonectria estremocensis]|uniref:C2H2-type domain-containing protein n=1 Tax=Dactylonectria estremocensis TaxID=1079267 RepID=A0A9P9IWH7_9HYPO|nr:hypothetical protein B0J13DRAFT_92443 [Dactylonectria estremocensis]
MDLTPPSLTTSPVPPQLKSFESPPSLSQTSCAPEDPGASYPSPSHLTRPLTILASHNCIPTSFMSQRFSDPENILHPSATMSHAPWVAPDEMAAAPTSVSSSTVSNILPADYDSFATYEPCVPSSFGTHEPYLPPPPNHSFSHPPPPPTGGPARVPPIPTRHSYGYLHDASGQRMRMESSPAYCQDFERPHYSTSVPASAPYSSEGSHFGPNLQSDLGDSSPVPVWPKQDCDTSQIYLNPQAQGSDLGQDRRIQKPARARRPPRKHTTKEEANFQCEVKGCGKFFSRSYNYKSHLETHDEKREYPFPCPVDGCTKKFVRKTDLQRHHQSVHMKERNHKCDFCGRLFARKDTLRRQVPDV